MKAWDLVKSISNSIPTAPTKVPLVANRPIVPGSEFLVYRQWFEQSAMGELLETDFAVAERTCCIGPWTVF